MLIGSSFGTQEASEASGCIPYERLLNLVGIERNFHRTAAEIDARPFVARTAPREPPKHAGCEAKRCAALALKGKSVEDAFRNPELVTGREDTAPILW